MNSNSINYGETESDVESDVEVLKNKNIKKTKKIEKVTDKVVDKEESEGQESEGQNEEQEPEEQEPEEQEPEEQEPEEQEPEEQEPEEQESEEQESEEQKQQESDEQETEENIISKNNKKLEVQVDMEKNATKLGLDFSKKSLTKRQEIVHKNVKTSKKLNQFKTDNNIELNNEEEELKQSNIDNNLTPENSKLSELEDEKMIINVLGYVLDKMYEIEDIPREHARTIIFNHLNNHNKKNKVVVQKKKKEKTVVVKEQCDFILTSGGNKGNQCNNRKTGELDYCTKHSKKIEIDNNKEQEESLSSIKSDKILKGLNEKIKTLPIHKTIEPIKIKQSDDNLPPAIVKRGQFYVLKEMPNVAVQGNKKLPRIILGYEIEDGSISGDLSKRTEPTRIIKKLKEKYGNSIEYDDNLILRQPKTIN